jgi:hypothetical protein
MDKKTKEERKELLKKYQQDEESPGLEGEFDHLKEGVDYLDDIQRNKTKIRPQSTCKRWKTKTLGKNEYWSPQEQ